MYPQVSIRTGVELNFDVTIMEYGKIRTTFFSGCRWRSVFKFIGNPLYTSKYQRTQALRASSFRALRTVLNLRTMHPKIIEDHTKKILENEQKAYL